MAGLGLKNYRMSLSWPRILPQGTGAVNKAGLDFYDKLIDELLSQGITPWITLFHWDLPQALQDQGGWANRKTVDAYAAYTDLVTKHFGNRVKNWMTHNEPWVFAFCGTSSRPTPRGSRTSKRLWPSPITFCCPTAGPCPSSGPTFREPGSASSTT